MRRREFIAAAGAVAAWPFGVQAGTSRKPAQIGYLDAGYSQNMLALPALGEGLRALGYVEGHDFAIVARFAEGINADLDRLARELVGGQPDVIVAVQENAARAIEAITRSIPVVSTLLQDPVVAGLIKTMAHPGGNVTGIMVAVDGMPSKVLELTREAVPGAGSIGILFNPTNPVSVAQRNEIEGAARPLSIRLLPIALTNDDGLDPAFNNFVAAPVQAVIVVRDALMVSVGKHINALALARRLPTIFGQVTAPQLDGLLSYGIDTDVNFRRAAYFVDKILKGESPADLPVEFPTKLQLVINLKTAKALGLTLSPSLLARADRVIE